MKRLLPIPTIFPALLFVSSALAHQTAPNPGAAPTTLHVTTQLTVVDVTVTDAKGNPVHGLARSDFIIKEDGKPQPIRNFDEYGIEIPSALPALPKLPPGIYTNQPSPAPTTSATNIILLDDVVMGGVHANPQYFMYSKLEAQNFLKKLPPGTPVAIMENADKLLLIQNVTTDRDVLLAAIDKVAFKAIPGVTLFPPQGLPHARVEHIASFTGQAQLTVAALTQIAAFAAAIKGRKNLIWLTPGIPWLTNPSMFGGGSVAGISNLADRMRQVYGLLTAAQVAIYTIDSHGLDGGPTAETPGVDGPSGEFIQRSVRQESLKAFAEATGGKAYLNRNDLDTTIGEAIATGSDYYSISYIPPRPKFDEQYHTIDVKVDRPGLHLQYQNGYTATDLTRLNRTVEHYAGTVKTAASTDLPPAISQFRANMVHGALPSTQLLLAVRVLPSATAPKPAPLPVKGELNPKLNAKSLVRYDVVYAIPPGQVTLSENPDGTRKASVELDIVVYGEDGTKLNVLRQTANVTLKQQEVADFQAKPFEVPLQLDLPPGKLFVRVGALDVLSGKAGTLEVSLTVAKP